MLAAQEWDQNPKYAKTVKLVLKKNKTLKSKTNRLVLVFVDADLRKGHKGLSTECWSEKIVPSNLKAGEFILFLNRSRNAIKMLAPGNILIHQKMPEGEKISLSALKFIPLVFNSTEMKINMKLAVELGLKDQLKAQQHTIH